MSRTIHTNLNFNNVSRIENLPDPVDAQQAATKAYVDANIEGLGWKDSVVAATTGNIDLASPGSTIDGVTMGLNDRFLVKDQTAAEDNGIYIWNGASTPATRAADMSVAAEFEAAVVAVEEGTTNADSTWRQTEVNITVGTDDVTFTNFGTAVPSATESVEGKAEIATQTETDTGTDDQRIVTPEKLALSKWAVKAHQANVGDGSATQYDITHNFGTRDVIVQVIRNSGNYDEILCDISRTDTNTVRLNFSSAPSSNQYRALIIRATNA